MRGTGGAPGTAYAPGDMSGDTPLSPSLSPLLVRETRSRNPEEGT